MALVEKDYEPLWSKVASLENIEDRKELIYKDVMAKRSKFKKMTNENPSRLFKLLGGDRDLVERTHNWADDYTYDEYVDEHGEEFDEEEEAAWDLDGKSIERAIETGQWFVTGLYIMEGNGNIKLPFEFSFCEGYLEGIIGTPYNTDEDGNEHGILFY